MGALLRTPRNLAGARNSQRSSRAALVIMLLCAAMLLVPALMKHGTPTTGVLAINKPAETCMAAISSCNEFKLPGEVVCSLLESARGSTFGGSGPSKIPKLIHQSWKDTNIPSSFTAW